MILLPVTEAQRSFIQIEVVERHEDSEDPQVRSVVEVVRDHLNLKYGGGLAVPNIVLADLLLEVINGIDDAIEHGESERQGYGNAREARNLHRTGAALLKKVRQALKGRGLGDGDDWGFEPSEDPPESARDSCVSKLQALKHGDEIRIGGKKWVVWRYAHERTDAPRGVEVFVLRAGSKGKKLYRLVPFELEGCKVHVQLVNGMGEVIQGPVATGDILT